MRRQRIALSAARRKTKKYTHLQKQQREDVFLLYHLSWATRVLKDDLMDMAYSNLSQF